MMKNIKFYTIAVLFGKLPTPKVNCCLYMNIQYLTFDIVNDGFNSRVTSDTKCRISNIHM